MKENFTETGKEEENLFLLRRALEESIANNPSDALLLSGGIDSSLLAALDRQTPAITVVLEDMGPDLKNAQQVTEQLCIPWYLIEISEDEALEDLESVMRITKSYDPAILNDIPIYRGIKYAQSRSWNRIRTGDAADSLFAGYSYLNDEENYSNHLEQLIPEIRLASSRIGKEMGARMNYPYLDPKVTDVARDLSLADNTAYIETEVPGDFFDSTKDPIKRWGKIPIRKIGSKLLPQNIAWRTKTDLEFGSGMSHLGTILNETTSRHDTRQLEESGKTFWNKMHGKMYLMYKDMGIEADPVNTSESEVSCTWCGEGLIPGRSHCLKCGAYPATEATERLFIEEQP